MEKNSIFQHNMVKYSSVSVCVYERYLFRAPKVEHKNASHAPDPRDVYRLPNCEHPFLQHKQSPEWTPISASTQITLSYILFWEQNLKQLKRKKKIKVSFWTFHSESHIAALSVQSIYSKGSGCSFCQVNYLASFSVNVLLQWECLTGCWLRLQKVKYYKIIHRLR